jgi:hypothetical protein|tara:strand:+ start:462 stop:608 length:147 start_codon:yes stop_codon:yes gene_type:complete
MGRGEMVVVGEVVLVLMATVPLVRPIQGEEEVVEDILTMVMVVLVARV